MIDVSATLDPAFTVAPVRRRTFGSFVEHLGRCVYTGIYEPGHPTADADGFRTDVLDLTRELGVTAVRYPGGNFVSGYRWEDGVGPRARRPVRRDLAWRSLETNEVGLDEFLTWAGKAGIEPIMAVNLGTRGVEAALDLLEYANHPGGTYWSDQRIANGAAKPYDIRMWCLGNELDGPWQLGHKTAAEYGRLAAETGRAMKMADPGLELVACGSSGSGMATFGAWEAEVLAAAYEQVDFISLHAYYEETGGDLGSFLGSAVDMDGFIDAVVATADHVRAKVRAKRRIQLSFDEWNVWYLSRPRTAPDAPDWQVAPHLLEDRYHLADAVVVGSLLICLLRHSDRVTAACQAQLVNVIAPIVAEPGGRAWRQTTFHPFAQAARFAVGDVLRLEPRGPEYDTAKYGPVPFVDAVATHDAESGAVTVFAVNRSTTGPVRFSVDARAFGGLVPGDSTCLWDADPYADRVEPRPHPDVTLADGRLTAVLPPVSWNVLRLTRPD